MTKLVNIYHKKPYDVYIGRAGKGNDGYFGNPIPLGASREDCLAGYREYFNNRMATDTEFKERIESLRGKTLGCFCSPKLCHGMVIIEYLEGISPAQQIVELEDALRRNTPSLFD